MSEIKTGAGALGGPVSQNNPYVLPNQANQDFPNYRVNAGTEAVRKYLEQIYGSERKSTHPDGYQGRSIEEETLLTAIDKFYGKVAKKQKLDDLLKGEKATLNTYVKVDQLPQALVEFVRDVPLSLLSPTVAKKVQKHLGDKAPENMTQLSLRKLGNDQNFQAIAKEEIARFGEQSKLQGLLTAAFLAATGAEVSFKTEVADGVTVGGKGAWGDNLSGEVTLTGKITGRTELHGTVRYNDGASNPAGASIGVKTGTGRFDFTAEQSLNPNKTKLGVSAELDEDHNLELELEKDRANGTETVGVTYKGGGEGNVQGAVGVKHITGDNSVTRIHFGVKGKF